MWSAAMKTTSDEIKILFSGKEYVIWSSQIFKKIFHFSFEMKNKLDEDLYQSKANKHLQLLASVAKQNTLFTPPWKQRQAFPDTLKPECKSASIQVNRLEV